MINSVSRVMASSYRNNTKQNNTSFKGVIKEDLSHSSFITESLSSNKGFFSGLLSFLNPLNHIGSGIGKSIESKNLKA